MHIKSPVLLTARIPYFLCNLCRYGTTTYSLPPYNVLHTDLIGADAEKLKVAVEGPDKPMVVVVAHEGLTPANAKLLLVKAGLWFL